MKIPESVMQNSMFAVSLFLYLLNVYVPDRAVLYVYLYSI